MHSPFRSSRLLPIAALLVVAVVALTAYALASGSSSSNVVLCAGKQGALSLASHGKCANGDKKLTIAKRGPAGPRGKPGKDGSDATAQPGDLQLVGTGNCDSATAVFCKHNTSCATSGWENYGGGYAQVGFRKDSAGFVHLQGVALGAESGDACVNTVPIFYLPSGYRPSDAKHEFAAQVCGGGETYVDVGTDGAVHPGDPCVSLDGIEFVAGG